MISTKAIVLGLAVFSDSLWDWVPNFLPPSLDPVEMQRAFARGLLRPTIRGLDSLVQLREFYERRGDAESLRRAQELRAEEARVRREIEYLRMGVFPPVPLPAPKNP